MVDFKKEMRDSKKVDEQRYWDKKRGEHQLKNYIVRFNWKVICERLGVDDYEGEWDDSLSYDENNKRLVDNLDIEYLRY